MTVSSDNWATLLQASLEHWSQGRSAQGGKGLQQVIGQLQGPAMAIWRALVYNQLALLSNQLGHWQYAKDQWELAQEAWRNSGMPPGAAELNPTLDWYTQLLATYGFADSAETVKSLHAAGQPPLIDPWTAPDKTARLALAPSAPTPLVSGPEEGLPDSSGFAPLGGATVQWRPSQEIAFDTWYEGCTQALKLASESKLPQALNCIDKARDKALVLRNSDGGHALALVYNAESLACFLAGDYSSATQARQEASRLWTDLKNSAALYRGDTHDKFAAALREADQQRAADLFLRRHGQRQCPLIDPWVDLESGLSRGEWQQQSAFVLSKDWKPKVESALQHLSRGNGLEAGKELGLMQQKMSADDLRGSAGALLLQLQALIAYASGDYDAAQEFFTKGRTLWDQLPKSKRRDGPYLEQTKSLLTMYQLESIADHLTTDSLCDPFLYYKPEHQMQRVEAGSTQEGDSRGTWEEQLREAWEMARAGRWEQAQRRASHAERVARLIDAEDLRVCYSLNSQAVFAQAAGNYADAETIYGETERAWKRGARSSGARTAWSEFCLLLRESDWPDMARKLEAKWEQPVAKSAFDPVLLPLDSLAEAGMKTMEAPRPDLSEEETHVLRLPTAGESRRSAAAPERSGFPWIPLVLIALIMLGLGGWWVTHRSASPPAPASSASP